MKCNQSSPGFELGSPCSFPTTITITPNKHDNNTVPDTSSVLKQKQPNWNELPRSENENATLPNNAQPCNPTETLSQEQKLIQENVKRIVTYTDACGNIVNTIMTNKHTSLGKYTSHTLFEMVAKGLRKDYVWGVSWRLNRDCNILTPQFLCL